MEKDTIAQDDQLADKEEDGLKISQNGQNHRSMKHELQKTDVDSTMFCSSSTFLEDTTRPLI